MRRQRQNFALFFEQREQILVKSKGIIEKKDEFGRTVYGINWNFVNKIL